MKSFVLLQNSFYEKSSYILSENIKSLLNELDITDFETQRIVVENKFLPLLNDGIPYFLKLFKAFIDIVENDKVPLFYDTQTLIAYQRLFSQLRNNSSLRDSIIKKIGKEIDIVDLESHFVLFPQLLFDRIYSKNAIYRKWNGFTCALIVDRELEMLIKQYYVADRLSDLTGLKIKLFYKESYDYLLLSNKRLCFSMSCRDYYEMVDCGVDFIATASIGVFHIFDEHSKEIQKASGRDDLNIPILFIPQIIRAMFDNMSSNKLLFLKHAIKPKMME